MNGKLAATKDRAPTESLKTLRSMVGHTPMIELRCVLCGQPVRVFAKNEQRNMTGSMKDRMVLWILRRVRVRVCVSCAGSGRGEDGD
ncbi:MAG: hypothetical protein IH985_02440 [Planctomycetes bacterium]|nr:hypothetical protein [Planctomycetota bacterium]